MMDKKCKIYYSYLDEIDGDILFEGLLGHGMFVERLPNFLTSESFFYYCVEKEPEFKQQEYRYIKYEGMKHNNTPRYYAVPNPLAYYKLCKTLKKYWKELQQYFKATTQDEEYKISRIHIRKIENDKKLLFIRSGDYDEYRECETKKHLFEMNYKSYRDDGNPEQEMCIGKRYKVKTDISTCFPSIYTHSIPWAIDGKEQAKKNFSERKSTFANKIDSATTWMNNKETNGILIGPHSSNLISEIILTAVDKDLREARKKQGKSAFQYVRHIDDYTCYLDSYEEVESFILELSQCLKKYNLLLNHQKTKIIELPISYKEDWIRQLTNIHNTFYQESKESAIFAFVNADFNLKTSYYTKEETPQIAYKSLSTLLDMAIKLMRENDNKASILAYTIKILQKTTMAKNVAQYYIDVIHHLVLLYPYLVAHIEQVFDKFFHQIGDKKIQKIAQNLCDIGKKTNNTEASSYGIYFAMKYNVQISIDVRYILRSENCILMMLGYLYTKKQNKCVVRYIVNAKKYIIDNKNKEDKKIKILDDEFWLFAYEVLRLEKPSELDQCEDWKMLKDANISFISTSFLLGNKK